MPDDADRLRSQIQRAEEQGVDIISLLAEPASVPEILLPMWCFPWRIKPFLASWNTSVVNMVRKSPMHCLAARWPPSLKKY